MRKYIINSNHVKKRPHFYWTHPSAAKRLMESSTSFTHAIKILDVIQWREMGKREVTKGKPSGQNLVLRHYLLVLQVITE